jgi:hypothetical protein
MNPARSDAWFESLGLVAVAVVLEAARRWVDWLFSPGSGGPVKPSKPAPASNWIPHDQEEAGPNTSAWVEEKLRAAKRN